MFIIWGNKSTSKIEVTVNKQFNCDHCHNSGPYQIKKYTDWFTLYFIPVIPMHTVYRAECPVCNYGFEIDKKRAKEIIQELKEEE